MLKFLKKRWILIFAGIFLFGFLVGYFTMTWVSYKESWNSQTFWQILKPF